MGTRDYCPSLSTVELVVELEELHHEQRQTERLICRYLADLGDRMEGTIPSLSGYADVYHLARCQFGLSFRGTRERIRVGRALRELPATEQALMSGELSYSRVREITRVARPENESMWIVEASRLSIRQLEQRVGEASPRQAGAAGGGAPEQAQPVAGAGWSVQGDQDCIHAHFRSPELMEVRMTLSPDAWAMLERALQGARRASEQALSDVEALVAVARDALVQQAEGSADLRRAVVLYECESCGRTELETGGQPMDLSPEMAATLGCGAEIVDLKQEGQHVQRGGPMPAAVRRAVQLRDRNRCRVPGCQLNRYVDVHHLQAQSRGGEHSRKNCLCLCGRHHDMLHAGKLRIEGNADAGANAPDRLRFWHADGEPIIERHTVLSTTGPSTTGLSPGLGLDAYTSDEPVDETHCGSEVGTKAPPAPKGDASDALASRASHGGVVQTHCGSGGPGVPKPGVPMDPWSELSPEATKLLAIMGHRGGWHIDSLCEKSGLSVSEVACAVLTLELGRQVEHDGMGCITPLR